MSARPSVLLLPLLLGLFACRQPAEPRYRIPHADAERGRRLIAAAGCGACHVIPGVNGARGMVGPPLVNFANRAYVGGQLANTPDALAAWVRNAPAFDSATAMPAIDFTPAQARDVAAYLYTLGEADPPGPPRLFPSRWVESW